MENINFFEEQKSEAICRMNMLRLHENVIKEFADSGKLNVSVRGILYWLNEAEKQMVKDWESETGNLVYHVIKNNMEFGVCYSFLYVSQNEEEWEMDRTDLKEGFPLVYVKNADDDFCSEYGSIGIKPCFGGLLRTA